MKTFLRKIQSLLSSPRATPWAFLVVALLVYGSFAWLQGFYWDDLPISWIRYQLGAEAMKVYFATSRPVWAMLYQITTGFIPQVPVYWQYFAIICRWLSVLLVWAVATEIWRGRKQMALTIAFLFLLYPALDLHWAAFLSSHFYIVLCFFLLSYLFMLWAFRMPQRFIPLTILALVFSLLNLWMMEYFYFLELIRPFIIYYVLSQSPQGQPLDKIAQRIFLRWLPYLLAFLANVFYRAFVFTNVSYQNVLLSDLRTEPVRTLIQLVKVVLSDLWLMAVGTWGTIFKLPSPVTDGLRISILFVFTAVIVGALAFIFLRAAHDYDEKTNRSVANWAMGIGVIAMLLAGIPFWIASLDVNLTFPANRFAISFMLGACLFLTGVLEFIPSRYRVLLATLLIALAAGKQVMVGNDFRKDWEAQENLFWQMTWRAPGLKPDTLVLMNEELIYYADNSLSASLNWIYAPNLTGGQIPYVLLYPTNRLGGSLRELKPGVPVRYSYEAGKFNGNTSDAVAFYYNPPACLRLLDPVLDVDNRFISEESLMRQASALSNADRILAQQEAVMPAIYSPEPVHGWCYYFEKADLARQLRDWEEVVRLGDKAFKLDDYPNNPIERFVFVEGYAHVGQWERAIEISNVSYKVSKDFVGPLLCQLWERIETETTGGLERSEALSKAQSMFVCNP
jgi:hypothetical protein